MDARTDMDPCEVLRLPRDYTLEQLKSNYRRMAAQLVEPHCVLPPREARAALQAVTEAYKALYKAFLEAQTDAAAAAAATTSSSVPAPQAGRPPPNGNGNDLKAMARANKYDMARFNRVFAENRPRDPYDEGCGDWKKQTCEEEEDAADEPLPVNFVRSSRSLVACAELGVDRVRDFGRRTEQSGRGAVQFSDLRNAYGGGLFDPERVPKRGEFKSLEELREQRSDATLLRATPEQVQAMRRREELLAKEEEMRLGLLARHDEEVSAQHALMHMRLFGDPPAPLPPRRHDGPDA